MAFPASNGALSETLESTSNVALQMKGQAQQLRDRSATQNVDAGAIIETERLLRQYRAIFVKSAGVSGIGAYAQSQLGSPSLDVVAELNGIIAAIDGVTAWIRSNIPVGTAGAAGYLLIQTWPAGQEPAFRTFTPTQTAGLRTQLDALIATVA